MFLKILILSNFVNFIICLQIQDLGGIWTVSDSSNEYEINATVPGGIYTDLMKNKKIGDIFYRFNDVETRWVSKRNWNYNRIFTVQSNVLQHTNINLVLNGVDTFSRIFINGIEIGVTENMFVKYIFDIKPQLKLGDNKIEVQFESPVNKAKELFDTQAQNYKVVPLCVPTEYNGECHANHVRKMQASFSWDWGPAFPSMGIWKKVYVEFYNSTTITDVTVDTTLNISTDSWDIDFGTYFEKNDDGLVKGTLLIGFQSEAGEKSARFENLNVRENEYHDFVHQGRLSVPKADVHMWWPNGYGEPKLYTVNITYISENSNEVSTKIIRIGFRTVELVQDVISSGRMFYFKINDVAIYAKGSNSIPISVLPELGQKESTIRFLLQSSKDVHMNMLRVWGGGTYEADLFYDVADEMGILIWQDFMFACSMYPTSEDFLRTVKDEVKHQVRRLHHHPSVVLWAGNNENEAALRQNWYGTKANFSTFHQDYVTLYADAIKDEFHLNDKTRPYLVSSPTNGIKSEEEGFVAQNPQSHFYGDVHFYNYVLDSWKPETYPICRFSSEYGYQALPSINTILTATNETNDLIFGSKFLTSRQHQPFGYTYMRSLIRFQLRLPKQENPEYLNALIYYSQILQAQAQKIQTEFYRQWRSNVDETGRGYTMGALYWQLNDVWVAPTWASIDFKNNWKMLHYFARNFFSPIIITGSLSFKKVLDVYVVSDLLEAVPNAQAVISVYNWNSLKPVHNETFSIDIIPEASSKIISINLREYLSQIEDNPCGNWALVNCFVYFSLLDQNRNLIAPNNYVFPKALKSASVQKANTRVSNIKQIDDKTFWIDVETDVISLFVWLETKGIPGQFSDNGFLLVTAKTSVNFTATAPTVLGDLQDSLTISNLMDFS